jgi:uroporphyrinogen-III synthase
MLASVAHTIAAESYVDRILQAISEMLADAFDSPVTCVLLADLDKRELTVSAARCSAPEYLHRVAVNLDQSVTERVMRQAQPVYIKNVPAENDLRFPELARRTGLAAMLAVPLVAHEKPIGAIHLYTRDARTFDDEEINLLRAVASQAVVAIENARLMEETLEMKRALETRKLVERAKGILQQKYGLTEEEAYLRLRNESRRMRRAMRDLAEAIILAEDISRKTRDTPAEEP